MSRKRYKVVGTQPVLQHQPGSTFEADLSDVEDFLLGIGALRVVQAEAPKSDKKSAERR